jgi:thiol:disulfide interchange protein
MKKRFAFFLSLSGLWLLSCNFFFPKTPTPEPPVESPSEKFAVVTLKPADGQLADLLKAEAQKAGEMGFTPFVEFHADWCAPCKALSKSLGDPRMVDAFAGTYVIRLNVDEWLDQPADAGFTVKGIPAFFAIDEAGKPTGRFITGAAWGEDIPENMAPPLKEFFTANKY